MVVSKGTTLSYSIYRSAAICNFLCFALDIAGILSAPKPLRFSLKLNMNLNPNPLYGDAMWRWSYYMYYFPLLHLAVKCAAIGGFAAVCVGVITLLPLRTRTAHCALHAAASPRAARL